MKYYLPSDSLRTLKERVYRLPKSIHDETDFFEVLVVKNITTRTQTHNFMGIPFIMS